VDVAYDARCAAHALAIYFLKMIKISQVACSSLLSVLGKHMLHISYGAA